jgi:hypothetical protein
MMTASPATLGRLLAEAFRSGKIPPFAELLSRVFGAANPLQQTRILAMLMERLSEAALASMPDADAIDGLVGWSSGRAVLFSSRRPAEVSPDQIKRLARLAEWHDPAIVDRMSRFWAEQPNVFAALDDGTLAVISALLDSERGFVW